MPNSQPRSHNPQLASMLVSVCKIPSCKRDVFEAHLSSSYLISALTLGVADADEAYTALCIKASSKPIVSYTA